MNAFDTSAWLAYFADARNADSYATSIADAGFRDVDGVRHRAKPG